MEKLWEKDIDILIGLVTQEIRHMADIKAEFREKDIDCGGVSTRIDNLQAILRRLTHE